MLMTSLIMGMPISVQLGENAPASLMGDVFDYFADVDRRFSLYKATSEISCYNRGELAKDSLSAELHEVMKIANQTRQETNGYFDMRRADGTLDPSGIVKGWAVRNAAYTIRGAGVADFYVNAGGDIQTGGNSPEGKGWVIGIQNPFNETEIIKAVSVGNRGVATSGNYVRGQHIYNPLQPQQPIADIISMTVIGPDVLDADRFATAAFAMGSDGIYFIEKQPGFEAYVISTSGIATQTTGFGAYVIQ